MTHLATNNRPYRQTFVYDTFGHLTSRPINKVWSKAGGEASPAQFANERNTAWTYDADGNLINSFSEEYRIDAAGQTSRFISYQPIETPPGQPIEEYGVTLDVTQTFDGDGSVIKKVAANTVHGSQGGDQTTTHTTYLLRSSLLGAQVITELGASERGFVYLGGSVLAVQGRPTQSIQWEHRDVGNGSLRLTSINGSVGGGAELDPLGGDAGLSAPVTETPSPAQYWKFSSYPGLGGPTTSMNCIMDFIPTPCSEVGRALNAGIAEQCKNNNCGPRIVPIHSEGTIIGEGLAPLTRDPRSGRLGYAHIYTGGKPPLSNTAPVLRRPGSNRSPGNVRDEYDFTFADGPQDRLEIGFDRLWDNLSSILENPTCGSFIADLVGTAQTLTGKKAHAFSVGGMLAELARNPMNGRDGINLIPTGGKGNVGYGGWDKITGKGGVDLGDTSLHGDISQDRVRWMYRNLARDFLHEIVHTATKFGTAIQATGGYSDVELARAIFEITKDRKDNPYDPDNNPPGSHPTTVGGVIYRRALEKYCP